MRDDFTVLIPSNKRTGKVLGGKYILKHLAQKGALKQTAKQAAKQEEMAGPLNIGVDKSLIDGSKLKAYSTKDIEELEFLVGTAKAGTKDANKLTTLRKCVVSK